VPTSDSLSTQKRFSSREEGARLARRSPSWPLVAAASTIADELTTLPSKEPHVRCKEIYRRDRHIGNRRPNIYKIDNMNDMNHLTPWIATDQVTQLLEELYADAQRTDPLARRSAADSQPDGDSVLGFYRSMRMAYMAIGWEFGKLLYGLARSVRAETIVEFGISTIFLASAIRDNGAGRLITTEFESSKVARAKKNLAAAGVEEWVEFRAGDARETLSDPPRDIGMIFLDGQRTLPRRAQDSRTPTCAPAASSPAITPITMA
jgi:predicted O-methyltransferase YrrM